MVHLKSELKLKLKNQNLAFDPDNLFPGMNI